MAIVKRRRVSTASSDLGKLGSGVNCNNSNSIKEINPSNNQEKSKNSDVVESPDSNLINTETVKKMKMVCGSFYFPKDNPAKPLGEDAHFICEAAQTIGVADGVGSWSKKGVDAGEYARTLMTNASLAAQKIHNTRKRKAVDFESGTEIRAVDPLIVLEEAFEKTKENLELQGSSTACIVSFDRENRVLRAANVGDSGFAVLRRHRALFASPAMQHRFNCPYKLGNGERSDGPQSAHEMVLKPLEAGDIIVMGSDGLFDNMFPEQIEEILEATEDRRVDEELNDSEYCEMVASVLADIALENSMDPEFDSPFSKEAARYGMWHNGGKNDDITVVVAQIVA